MFDTIGLFQLAAARAQHAGQRQATTAANIANADTPGYRAQDVTEFARAYRGDGGVRMNGTREGHFGGDSPKTPYATITTDTGGALSPSGNSVSLEMEMLRSVEAEREHSRAVAVYNHGLTIMRSALGRR